MSNSSKKKRILLICTAAICLLAVICTAVVFLIKKITDDEITEEKTMYITDLKVNGLSQPIGIDTVPVFSWINRMNGYARSQSAYRIVVASSKEKAEAQEGDVWDSGKVESGISYGISYGGESLCSRTEYYFAIQCWDEGEASAWSDVSSFETGILDDSEWSAKWIKIKDGDTVKRDVDLSGANWIWYKNGAASTPAGNEYFRAHFNVDEKKAVDEVLLAVSMDDYGYLFVNCASVLTVKNEKNAWKTGNIVNITPYIQKGDNIFGARVVNTGSGAALSQR